MYLCFGLGFRCICGPVHSSYLLTTLYPRSCRSALGKSSKARWMSTTGESYSPLRSCLATELASVGFLVQWLGRFHPNPFVPCFLNQYCPPPPAPNNEWIGSPCVGQHQSVTWLASMVFRNIFSTVSSYSFCCVKIQTKLLEYCQHYTMCIMVCTVYEHTDQSMFWVGLIKHALMSCCLGPLFPSCFGGAGEYWPSERHCGGGPAGQGCVHPWHLLQNTEHLGGLLPQAERILRSSNLLRLLVAIFLFCNFCTVVLPKMWFVS